MIFADVAEFFVAAFEEVVDLGALQVAQGLGDKLREAMGGGVRIAMGAAERLGDDRIDHAQLAKMLAGELEALGQLRRLFIALEEDGRAGFGGDDRIPGEFHHGHAIGQADAQLRR